MLEPQKDVRSEYRKLQSAADRGAFPILSFSAFRKSSSRASAHSVLIFPQHELSKSFLNALCFYRSAFAPFPDCRRSPCCTSGAADFWMNRQNRKCISRLRICALSSVSVMQAIRCMFVQSVPKHRMLIPIGSSACSCCENLQGCDSNRCSAHSKGQCHLGAMSSLPKRDQKYV